MLIRGVEGISGPGRVTKALGIGLDLNREDYTASDVLWLEDGPEVEYIATPRIGIDSAGEEDRKQLWRFYVRVINKTKGVVLLSIFHEYLCKLGIVIAGLTRNLLRLEKIAGQARNDNAVYLFVFLLNETAPFLCHLMSGLSPTVPALRLQMSV